jgi:DNA-binding CsgD family transcriptional regulator
MATAARERLRQDIGRLVHDTSGLRTFVRGAAGILRRGIGFDGVCLLALDPATGIPTDEVVINGLPQEALARMAEIELGGDDVNSFAALARAPRPVAALSAATGGDLERSLRHRELRAPNGLGDEVRAVLAPWGALTLMRADEDRFFEAGELALVEAVAEPLAEGLRRAQLLAALVEPGEDAPPATGVLLLSAAGEVAHADDDARAWLLELERAGGALPPVVTAVAQRARAIARGDEDGRVAARARVVTATGRWVVVRGSAFEDGTAVTLEPAGPGEVAPLVAAAFGLTERERAVAELVAAGLKTAEIADRLHVSAWTVQDHLKAIFEKVGVDTRGALVARVFFAGAPPRLADGPPG